MALSLVVVDAFTDRPFSGNPAAVAVVDVFPPDGRMQQVAAEMNLAETAFCAGRPDGGWDLRWFTPTVEVALCGHATLATTHVLAAPARFTTRSGELVCGPGDDGWVTMDFPALAYRPDRLPAPLAIEGIVAVASSELFWVVEVDAATVVRGFTPDLAAIGALGSPLILTAAGDREGVDCVTRVFAPTLGIAEDPVTGSAHCLLAGYWAERTGRSRLTGEQASPRGGVVRMVPRGDRVELAGQAVTVARVEFSP